MNRVGFRLGRSLYSLLILASFYGQSALAMGIPPTPQYPAPDPNCEVSSIQKLSTAYENISYSADRSVAAYNHRDANGVYQLYSSVNGVANCLTCIQVPGAPRLDRQKTMIVTHPSGKWIFVGVEWNDHEYWWLPRDWQFGFIQSGTWIDMWVTTPKGDRWHRMTDYYPARQVNGYVGPTFTSDGKTFAWVEAQMGANMLVDNFGVWKLYVAEFDDSSGAPVFKNKRDISPAGAQWLEPGNFFPDNRRLMLSTDIGLPAGGDNGQDQWWIDIYTGELKQLTNTPTVWDEHGLISPSGKKIMFMSSYPFQYESTNPNNWNYLKTEFLVVNPDGSGLQQITHFNTASGYPESQNRQSIAAVGGFVSAYSAYASVMGPSLGIMENWVINFKGPCGGL